MPLQSHHGAACAKCSVAAGQQYSPECSVGAERADVIANDENARAQ